MDEVETLPTREYNPPSPGTLELRDKSDTPLSDEGAHEGGGDIETSLHNHAASSSNELEEDGEQDSPRGGLCENLLPSSEGKKGPNDEWYLDHSSCSICLDEYEPGECIRVLPCQHTFHSDCIFPWLTERSPTCPLCKAMFEAVQYEEGEGSDEAGAEEGTGQRDEDVATEESADVEQGRQSGNDNSEQLLSDPLADEPDVHRGRRREERRRQRQEERATRRSDRAARRSGRGGNGDAAVDEELPSDGDRHQIPSTSSEEERPTSRGLRGRMWGLFGTSRSSSAVAAALSPSDLEEPLLVTSSDSDGLEEEELV